MANESVKSRYAKVRPAKTKRRTGSRTFQFVLAGILVLGFGLVALTVLDRRAQAGARPRANKDHWHAYLGVNRCGTWLKSFPEFEATNGVHSHAAPNLVHLHPYTEEAAGRNATIGRFITNGSENITDTTKGSWQISSDSMKLWLGADGKQISVKKGEKCTAAELASYAASASSTTTTTTTTTSAAGSSSSSADATTTTTTTTSSTSVAVDSSKFKDEVGVLRWAVAATAKDKMVEQSGDIKNYRPKDGEVIVLYFLPKSAKLIMPPDVREAFLASSAGEEGTGNPATGSTASTVSVVSGASSSKP
ncbi:MAG: hypothetical protein WBD02_08900 [Acidimicrobiia bacterium]